MEKSWQQDGGATLRGAGWIWMDLDGMLLECYWKMLET